MKNNQECGPRAEAKEEDEETHAAMNALVKHVNRLSIKEMDEETVSSLFTFHEDDPAQRYHVLIVFVERMRSEFNSAQMRRLLNKDEDQSELFKERHGLLQSQFFNKYTFASCVGPFLTSSLEGSQLALPNFLVLLEICAFAFSIAVPLSGDQLTQVLNATRFVLTEPSLHS